MADAPAANPPEGDSKGTYPRLTQSAYQARTTTRRERCTLTADDPQVRLAIAYASQSLNRNPREIKRFVNLFRFYTMIYAERVLANLPAPSSLDEVAKLAVLGIRWPSLLGALAQTVGDDAEETVFELLERPVTAEDEAALKDALTSAGLSDAMITCLLTTSDLAAFLRSAPKVGAGVRGYL